MRRFSKTGVFILLILLLPSCATITSSKQKEVLFESKDSNGTNINISCELFHDKQLIQTFTTPKPLH